MIISLRNDSGRLEMDDNDDGKYVRIALLSILCLMWHDDRTTHLWQQEISLLIRMNAQRMSRSKSLQMQTAYQIDTNQKP